MGGCEEERTNVTKTQQEDQLNFLKTALNLKCKKCPAKRRVGGYSREKRHD